MNTLTPPHRTAGRPMSAVATPETRWRHVDSAEAVGRRLKEARLAAGLSQRELSFPGCTPVYICRIERGDRVPSLQLMHELADRLGTTPEYLCRGGEGRPPFAVGLDAAALDETIRGYAFRGPDGEVVGLGDLTPEEVERLRAQLRREARTIAGPLAAASIAGRDYPVGTA